MRILHVCVPCMYWKSAKSARNQQKLHCSAMVHLGTSTAWLLAGAPLPAMEPRGERQVVEVQSLGKPVAFSAKRRIWIRWLQWVQPLAGKPQIYEAHAAVTPAAMPSLPPAVPLSSVHVAPRRPVDVGWTPGWVLCLFRPSTSEICYKIL